MDLEDHHQRLKATLRSAANKLHALTAIKNNPLPDATSTIRQAVEKLQHLAPTMPTEPPSSKVPRVLRDSSRGLSNRHADVRWKGTVIYCGGFHAHSPGSASHYLAVLTRDLLELHCLSTQDALTATFRGITSPPAEDAVYFPMRDLEMVTQDEASSEKLFTNPEMNTTLNRLILHRRKGGKE